MNEAGTVKQYTVVWSKVHKTANSNFKGIFFFTSQFGWAKAKQSPKSKHLKAQKLSLTIIFIWSLPLFWLKADHCVLWLRSSEWWLLFHTQGHWCYKETSWTSRWVDFSNDFYDFNVQKWSFLLVFFLIESSCCMNFPWNVKYSLASLQDTNSKDHRPINIVLKLWL